MSDRRKLINRLSELYPTEDDARMMVGMADIPAGNIKFNTTAKNRWFFILKQSKLLNNKEKTLLEMAHAEYFDDPILKTELAKLNEHQFTQKDTLASWLEKLSAAEDTDPNIVSKLLEVLPQIKSKGASELVIETDKYEKKLGEQLNFLDTTWALGVVNAMRSVCLIKMGDGTAGTGWIYKGKYLMTNRHVIQDAEAAKSAEIIFNYQAAGGEKQKFTLDPEQGFYSSKSLFLEDGKTPRPEEDSLDYSCVAIHDPDYDLVELGSLNFGTGAAPAVGDLINIIQHPGGGVKKLAMLEAVSDISVEKKRIYYQADTLEGSSGSPVFNQDWEVVALHNASSSYNASGEAEDANKGILISAIAEDLSSKGFDVN